MAAFTLHGDMHTPGNSGFQPQLCPSLPNLSAVIRICHRTGDTSKALKRMESPVKHCKKKLYPPKQCFKIYQNRFWHEHHLIRMDRTRERQTFSIRSQIVTILAFEGHTVSVKTSPICPRRGSDNHRQYVRDWTRLYANKTLFVDTETGGSYNFPVSCQNHSSFDFLASIENVKTILSLQAIHRDWASFEHTLANPWIKSHLHRSIGTMGSLKDSQAVLGWLWGASKALEQRGWKELWDLPQSRGMSQCFFMAEGH